MEFFAPAKINLSLAVKGSRDDGFHEIETFISPVSIFDRLTIELREEGGLDFSCDEPALPMGHDNLVVRAANLFCADIGLEPHLRIVLQKTIPHGAGLGGGSSDAATTLRALDILFETRLPESTLISMAAELGSDVPFFICQSAAICRGRGEQVAPVAFPHQLRLLLIKPPFAVLTAWAYQRWGQALEIPGVPYKKQGFAWGQLVNDLERPVFEKYLFLAVLKRWLLEQSEVRGALMSGSGSTVFAILNDQANVAAIGDRIRGEFGENLWISLCETIGDAGRSVGER